MIYGEGKHFTLVRCADDAEWLERRKEGIGGSDVAAIMGLSPWKTPAQVWMEKTGRIEAEDISEKPYVKFGTIMEPIIGEWYAKANPDTKVRRVNAICKSVERPFIQASLDYEIRYGERWGILEIKTARNDKDWQEGVPPYYLTQVYHYMLVTGREFAEVAVFFRDSCEFRQYRVEKDIEDMEAVRAAESDFWENYVQKDVMPALRGTEGETKALTDMFASPADEFEAVDDDVKADIIRYRLASESEKAAKEAKQQAAARLMARIGKAKGIEVAGYRVTWVRAKRAVFDQKRFQEDYPRLWGRYMKVEERNQGLRIKELEE